MCHLALNSFFTCMPYLRSFYFHKPWRISLIIGMEDHYIFCGIKKSSTEMFEKQNQCLWHVDHIISHFFTELKIYHYSLIITHMTISTLLIQAVCRAHVIHKPCIWPSSPQVLCSSVVRASDQCTEGHRFSSFPGLRFFSLSRARDMLITSFPNFAKISKWLINLSRSFLPFH